MFETRGIRERLTVLTISHRFHNGGNVAVLSGPKSPRLRRRTVHASLATRESTREEKEE